MVVVEIVAKEILKKDQKTKGARVGIEREKVMAS